MSGTGPFSGTHSSGSKNLKRNLVNPEAILKNKLMENKIFSKTNLSWREKNGVIYLSVTSRGMSGREWITHLLSLKYCVTGYTEGLLLSNDFKPTNNFVYEVAVLKGNLFAFQERITDKIRTEALKRGYDIPNPEVACLIREKFSDADLERMGLFWIAVMHQPINGFDGIPSLIGVYRIAGGNWLGASSGDSDYGWGHVSGFAFQKSCSLPRFEIGPRKELGPGGAQSIAG